MLDRLLAPNHKTRELAGDHLSGFHREKDLCNTCKNVKLVIW